MSLAKLYLIPVPIAEDAKNTLSADVSLHTGRLKYYFAENARTARRFLRSMHAGLVLEEIEISEIDKHSGPDFALLRRWIKEGKEIGVLSEAGCPGIADPGAEIAAVAQQMGALVSPVTGPNSIILALMASGLNGQSFAFNGYLPVKDPARSQKIKELEARSKKEQQTQIFIETPYRNNAFLNDLLKNCQSHTRICIAQDITGTAESIVTKKVADLRSAKPQLGKVPVVFLLLSS